MKKIILVIAFLTTFLGFSQIVKLGEINLIGTSTGTSTTQWTGKKIAFFGDSMVIGSTEGNYQEYLEDITGAIYTNYGSSGANTGRLVGIMTTIKDRDAVQPAGEPDYTTFDAILIQIGTNEDVSFGTIADISTDSYLDIPATYATETIYLNTFADTFYGNIGICIEWVKEHNKDCKIYLVNIPPENSGTATNATDVRDALFEIGALYGVHVINALDNAGIEDKQLLKYSTDGTHLNYFGNELWGNYIGRQLNNN